VAKLDSLGNHLWSKKFGDQAAQAINGVDFDPGGNALFVGEIGGSADFGGGTLFSAGGNDVFVVKYGPAGNHLWSKQYGDAANQTAIAVATDASSNVIVVGICGGSLDFGLGPIPGIGTMFVAKVNAAGNTLWAKRFGAGNTSPHPTSVKTDGLGNIVIGGYFNGPLDFGGAALDTMGGEDIFVVKLAPTGNHLWSKSFGDVSTSQRVLGLALDAAGNVVITGEFLGTLNFGGAALVTTTLANTQSIFLAKLDSTGQHLWSKSFGDAMQQVGEGVAVGTGGTVFLTGYMYGSADFGGGVLTPAAGNAALLARFDASGNHLQSQLYGTNGSAEGRCVVSDGTGGLFLGGGFTANINFGTGLLTTGGGYDIFLARLGP
jgi:hypothetical protein